MLRNKRLQNFFFFFSYIALYVFGCRVVHTFVIPTRDFFKWANDQLAESSEKNFFNKETVPFYRCLH